MSQQRRLTSCAPQKKKLLPVAHYNISLNILTLPGKCPHSLDVAADCIPCVQCACTMARFEKHRPKPSIRDRIHRNENFVEINPV